MGRATAIRRCAAVLARRCKAPVEHEAGAGFSHAWPHGSVARTVPAALHWLSTSSGGVPADQLPLSDSRLAVDDVEDAVRSEADVPLDDDIAPPTADAAAAAATVAGDFLGGRQLVPTDNVATLPMGQALRQEAEFQGRTWAFETGKLARLASGSCLVQSGGTTVLAAATSQSPPWSRRDAQNLQFEVEYREKLYAVGRIPGTYNKREGAAKDHEVLASRRIGRALRPLFPKGFARDAAVFANVLSADGSSDPDVMAISAASAALMCSDMPWAGPVAAVRVALMPAGSDAGSSSSLVVAPSVAQQEAARLNLLVACTAERVTMLEADGEEVPEAEFLEALRVAVAEAQQLVEPQRQLAAQTGRQTQASQLAGADPAAVRKVFDLASAPVEAILRCADHTKHSRAAGLQQAKEAVLERLRATGSFRTDFARVPGSGCVSPSDLEHAFTAVLGAAMRRLALEEGWRCDGRGSIDVRPVHCEMDSVPIVHGSALFTRGETQSLCTATVGRRGEQQKMESLLGGEGSKRLFVNYTFPAFAVDDTNIGGQRREMGHSELAERALLPVLPDQDRFPFSLRLNADTLASSGSSSMAAVCGGSLALVDAGVPLKSLVAGISVGLLTEQSWSGEAATLPAAPVEAAAGRVAPVGRYELLTDLQGMEDQLGDMDLKVAGTRRGITACQLDVKLHGGVPLAILEEAFAYAARGRAKVLDAMERAQPGVRSPSAPMFSSVQVPEAMLGRVIGSGGSSLRELEERFDARVDVGEAGLLHVFAASQEGCKKAVARILDLAGESVREGEVYRGTVVRLLDYGAMLELEGSGLRALLHISEVAAERVRSIEDALKVGQQVEVLCLGKDPRGQVKLSRKAVLARQAAQQRSAQAVQSGGGIDSDK